MITAILMLVGFVMGMIWCCLTARLTYLSAMRMDWKDAAAKAERWFLLTLLSLMVMLFVAQFFVQRGKHNISAKMAGLCALEFLFMLSHVFWPSNLSTTGEAATDFGV